MEVYMQGETTLLISKFRERCPSSACAALAVIEAADELQSNVGEVHARSNIGHAESQLFTQGHIVTEHSTFDQSLFTPVPFVFTPIFPPLPATAFFGILPIFHPQLLNVLTILGVTAAVNGTLMKMKLLCIAYANASCVQIPKSSR